MNEIDKAKEEEYEYVKKYGKRVKGKRQYLKFLNGEYLSNTDAILAHCYQCMNYYIDGLQPCGDFNCPLYNSIQRIRKVKTKK